MRIIKLSADDPDFKTRPMVDIYFRETLPDSSRNGKFYLTNRAFGPKGIAPGEKLIFTYKGECVYKALAAGSRRENSGKGKDKFPHYFLINVASIEGIQGNLKEVQTELEREGLHIPNLVKSRAWPKFVDGERIAQVIEAVVSPDHSTAKAEQLVLATLPQSTIELERVLREVKLRLGQSDFRKAVIAAYQSRCAFSSCDAVEALEAAHIDPYFGIASNHPSNGLLLRGDIHTLFDANLIGIEPGALTIALSPALKKTSYADLHGKPLALPNNDAARPDAKALAKRWQKFSKK